MWISRITQILTENHVNITNVCTISSRHGPLAIRRIALQSQHACGLALTNKTCCNHSAKHLHLSISTWNREDVSEGWTRNDLVSWLSEKRCWMNSSLTSELKQTNMKKTQSVRNMKQNHQSWYTWLNKNEQQPPTVKTLLRLPRSHSDNVAER